MRSPPDHTRRIRDVLRPYAHWLQTAMAVLGFVLLLSALAELPYDGGPVSPSMRRFFVFWCVGVPYWYYVEYTYLLERDETGRPAEHGLRLQRYSQLIWLGAAIALGAFIARG